MVVHKKISPSHSQHTTHTKLIGLNWQLADQHGIFCYSVGSKDPLSQNPAISVNTRGVGFISP